MAENSPHQPHKAKTGSIDEMPFTLYGLDLFCHLCTEEKKKALKSCLDCGLTFCESHLEPHNNVEKLKRHKLINPVKNLEDYICQKHEKPLEMFCRDDQMYLCQFCTEVDHKKHKIIHIEEKSKEKKTSLVKIQEEVQQSIKNKLKKIQEIKLSAELSKKNTEKEKPESVMVFTALIRSIERSQAELLKMMENKEKATERQAEEFITELEQEITELKKRDAELENLLHTEDHLKLLQVYSSVCTIPPTENWTDRINTDLNVARVLSIMLKLQKTLNEKFREIQNRMLKETASAELRRIQHYTVDVTLDPETAHPNLILSDDQKQVRCGDTKQNLPDTPKRFNFYLNVLGRQGFSSGRFYYEVHVGNKAEWSLGVVSESIIRKGEIILTPKSGFWTIKLRNGKDYTARDHLNISLILRVKPQKVGVFVDYEEGLVSFYDVENRSHIYSFTGQCFTEKLYPYFNPGINYGAKISTPLIITAKLSR